MSFASSDAWLSYVPEFIAKTESVSNPFPRSFFVKSLSDLLQAWIRICCCALSEPCGCMYVGFLPLLTVLVIYLFRLVLPLVLCPRMVFHIFFERLSMKLGLAESWVFLSVPIVSGGPLPLLLSIKIGWLPVS